MQKKAMFVGAPIVIATMVLWSLACDSLRVNTSEIEYTNPVKVAFLGPTTVDRAGVEGIFLAAVIAAEEINGAGGVLGREIELVFRNDGGSSDIGIAAAQQLHDEGVDIIIGSGRSVVTLAIAPQVTVPNGMLLISYSSTNPGVTTLADSGLVWRTCLSDTYQGKIGADYCYNTLSKRAVGILAVQNPWALGLADSFEDSFESFGGTVTDYVIYPELPGSEASGYNYSPHLDTLFSERPDMICLLSFKDDGAKITNDIANGDYSDQHYDPFFFNCEGLYTPDFTANGHPAVLEGMHGLTYALDDNSPVGILFRESYVERFGFAPPVYSQHAYDALYLIAYGILKANSVDPSDIAAELRAISGGDPDVQGTIINMQEFTKAKDIISSGGDINYNGASGMIDFDENGDPTSGTFLIWNITNNQFGVETYVSFP